MRKSTEEQRKASTERVRQWRKKQLRERPEEYRKKAADLAKKRYHEDPQIAIDQQKNFKKSYNENPEFRAKIVHAASVNRYGMTPDEYNARLEEQGGHCALCEEIKGDAGRRLHIDHNHDCCPIGPPRKRICGKCNRGLLCGPCNRRLGALEYLMMEAQVVPQTNTWTERAMQYLSKWREIHKAQTQEAMHG
jgi:hypothetical protein